MMMPWTKILLDDQQVEPIGDGQGMRLITYREAILEAQTTALDADPRVFLLGEGVDDPGGIFGTTLGLADRFGKDRVVDIPIAENGLTGVAVGSAIAGLKPVFIHMRNDFLPMCMDQLVNHAAKWHYMSGGKVNVPLVVRAIIGRGWGSAAQHSQALHSLFVHIPGLKVVMPSTPYDAKGLFLTAIDDGNPVMFIEHRWTFDARGYVPEDIYRIPFGKGVVRRPGRDVTIIAVSHLVYDAMKAALILETEHGISAEILELRTLKPLDMELILECVGKTGRILIADPAWRTGGIGAEITCRIMETAPDILKAPVRRISCPDAPTPCSPVLEEAYYPQPGSIVNAVRALMEPSNRPSAASVRESVI